MSGLTMESMKVLVLAVLVTGSFCQDQDKFRLPDSVVPEHYDLKYTNIDFKELTFEGDVQIYAKVKSETKEIVLHKGKLDAYVTSVSINATKVEGRISAVSDNKTDFWTISLPETLTPYDNVIVDIRFNGILRDDMIGFYWSSYFNETGDEVFLAATQFESAHARHAFPCFDEPALKATFTISILPPDGYHCLSNMPHEKSETSKWYEFEKSVKMSTYLVAFVISDFQSRPLDRVSLWSRPNAFSQTNYGPSIGKKSLEYFEETLEQDYPLKKMDMVAVPDFSAGAMENWGLLTFRETASLYDDKDSSAVARQRIASVIVHECTHMWFGNLVTPEWWSYLWLSEAFARYYQYMATDKVESGWYMDQQFVVEQHQLALNVDAEEDSVPMTRPEEVTQAEIEKMGGTITYSKGASIVRMMELSFGSDVFIAALKNYLTERKYDSATPNDLWKALQKQVDGAKPKIDVAETMKEWTEKPGFPYLTVTILPDKIQLEQKRFLRSGNEVPITIWKVPITFLSSSRVNDISTKPVQWLTKATDEIKYDSKKDKWMIFNVNSAGFYRVNYDEKSWNKIINVLTKDNFEQIPVLNRAAIVDDLLNLARAEILDYNVALRGILYLRREKNYLPFKSALTSLDYLARRFSTTENDKTFNAFVLSLLSNVYNELTFDDKKGDDQLTILLRQELNQRACKLNHKKCISKSKEYFNQWRTKKTIVPANQRPVVYCTAIRQGNSEDWEFLWNQYRNANVATEQVVILSALGCTKNTTLLERYLLSALSNFKNSRIRKQDVSSVFSSVYTSNVEGAEYMLDFVVAQAEAIFKYYDSYDEIGNLISGALKTYPTEKLVEKLNKILSSNGTYIKAIKTTLEKSLKLANSELKWFNKFSTDIIKWINDKVKEEETVAYRLPSNVVPQAYKLQLNPRIEENNFTFNGDVEISAEVKNSTKVIVLHADQITIEQKDVTVSVVNADQTKKVVKVEKIDFVSKYHFTRIILEEELANKQKIVIAIKYTGILNTEMRGFYRSSYKDKSGITRWLAATHLEPVGARRVFPCFDEPALKATFDITVVAKKGYTVTSNTAVKRESENKDGTITYEFEKTPLMSTYLVAVVVSDFKLISEKDAQNRLYNVYSNPLIIGQMNYSLKVMRPTVEFFEKNLKHRYPLSKLDMVALPDFTSGAMENWGLMTFRETNLAYDPEIMSTVADKQSVRNVIAHEITHQWFGNLVSPLWWDYLWLSEGFARYFQFHVYTENENTWKLETQFVVDAMQTSFKNDASTGTHPITAEVYSPSQISGIFDTISYAKAASVIRMFQKMVGPTVFFEALYNYLDKCANSTGTPEDLFKAFKYEVDKQQNKFDVLKLMNNWTKNEGFPVINVTFDKETATFKQSRFYLRPPSNEKEQSVWMIPLTWTTGKNPNFNNTQSFKFLTEKSQSINIKKDSDDWIIFNLQQMGYYRVNYEPEMWRRLIGVLNKNHEVIHEINRAALLDDLLNLGRVGYVDYELVMEAARYLRFEKEYGPWKAAYNGFSYLESRFAGLPEFYAAYRTFILSLLENIIETVGFDDHDSDRHTDKLLRKLALEWMVRLDSEKYVEEAKVMFSKEKNVYYHVPANKQAYVYNAAMRHGSKEDWTYLWKKMKNSIYATERITLLTACAQSKDPELLKMILEDILLKENSAIRLQDVKKAFNSVSNNGVIGVNVVLDFIEAKYNSLQNYLKDDTVSSVLSTVSKRLSTKELLDKFEKIVKNSEETMPEIAKSLQSYLKRAKTERDWSKNKGLKILSVLNKYNLGSSYRLPTSVKPEAYELWIKPYFEDKDKGKEFTFEGKVGIDVLINKDTHYMVLQQENLKITKMSLNEGATVKIREELQYYDEKTHKLYIYFDEVVRAETKFRITFEYNAKLRDDMRGFYRSHYFDEDGNKKWIASTHFEPTYARRAFPCFDEPSFKATFTVSISRPNEYRTLSNMGSKPDSRKDGNDRTLDVYKKTLVMSPYLLAFVVSDFKQVKADKSRVQTWSRANLVEFMGHSADVGEKSLSYLEDFTKITYPLEEMNFVAVPDFDMGAMENWGLVTYREYGLTYDVKRTSATYKRYVLTTVAHELVHQWFGNLVTCDWWDYAWLNEGFAEYVSYIISAKIEPDWSLMEQFVVKELQVGLDHDSLESSHPMNNKVATPAEAQATFDKITYQKAASVLRMLHHSFGTEAFEESLHNYLSTNSYKTGTPELLYQAIKERLGKGNRIPGDLKEDVVTVMKSWTTQSGYPVITVVRKDTAVEISQKRFLVSPSDDTESKEVYWTPITFTTEDSKEFKDTSPQLWLGKEPQQLQLNLNSTNTWYILNVQVIGFYRVNYDKENWKQLISVLNSNNYTDIHVLNRAQILDDSLYLARAGQLDYGIALNASKYLTREDSYIAWKAYFNGLAYLARRVEGNSDIKNLFSRYIVKLVDNNLKKLGFKDNMEKDTQLDQLNRELLVTQACYYGHEDCSKAFLKDPSITPNVASYYYCFAVERSTSEEWDKLWETFTKTQMSTEYLAILRGLGCSKNSTILEKYLNHVFEENSKIRRQDVAAALSSIYSSSQEGLEASFSYYKSNLDKLRKFFDNWDDVGSLFTSLVDYLVTEEQIKNFENLANDESAKEIKTSLEKAVKKAKKNLKWFSRNSENIKMWLEKFDDSTDKPTEKPTEKPSDDGNSALMIHSLPTILIALLSMTIYFLY